MWREATEQVCNMLAMDPYPGYQGRYFSMPCRNLVPKPVQRPHPPLWLACSNRETIHIAAQLGVGALTFAFVDPGEAAHWVRDYYETFKRECVPIGHVPNPNIAMVTGFSCHADAEEASRRGTEGFRFFQFALGHHYVFGRHTPGRTDIWKKFEKDLKKASKNMENVKAKEEKTDEVCDKCGSAMVIKWGRYGKFLACSNYPECKNTRQLAGGEGADTLEWQLSSPPPYHQWEQLPRIK